ncbi:hypothetical protein NUJ30_08360 [Burkholderia contaminans]|uniref:hypothetical protein n=1 Tax=Burkholderia TaxID=32008 RepID=UPI0010F8FF04|nr:MULTISPECIES: hypothetical protein [Burkholderia]MBD1412873.1 hypothetical protein [Burkholderia contaminans]UXZ68677.1 hypothetical protein NUJ29_08365 [Burkholderia contaminans]UXZ76438.1 hypothetical protein NUJ30_08360 [Burkholderia contaminans]
MTNEQRIRFMYCVALAAQTDDPSALDALEAVKDEIGADEGLTDAEIAAVLRANAQDLARDIAAGSGVEVAA